MTLSKER